MNKIIPFCIIRFSIAIILLSSIFSCNFKSGEIYRSQTKQVRIDTPTRSDAQKESLRIDSSEIISEPKSSESILFGSWNLKDFGKSKSAEELDFIADNTEQLDVLAIQEVVAGDGGAEAVARLCDILNRKGAKWDYIISDPTSGDNSYKRERYAFLWKPGKLLKTGEAWLEKQYSPEIDREPFFATFTKDSKTFTLVNFHAITKNKQPEKEIKYFKFLPAEYPEKNLIFSGDFNCPQSHTVFKPLKKMGYQPILTNQKTSLKKSCNNQGCLASEFDNMFYNKTKVSFVHSGVIHFYKSFPTLGEAAKISDHLPIIFEFSLN